MTTNRTRTLYIANRGEIARRIATTATRSGLRPVVAETDGADAVDLLSPAAIVGAARAAGAWAVHPGYGFLAESPELASAVLDAGIVWVGPPPEAIRTVGDKAAARAVARRMDVPVADGEEPADQADESLAAAAERIGYPVVLKPAAGGGGKGIRVVREPGSLAAALVAARREARRAFADERLLVEGYVEGARHVEVQVLADGRGSVVHLGDRDCSLQRRHQKILEEAPAPGLDDATRRTVWASAVRIAAAVGYVSAGTCEFLVADDGAVVFLEMNARLQVEHPVTELVLGRDLVADQLAVADGAALADLGIEQAAIEARLGSGGHAIEVRLNAEDPANGFLPSAGRIVAVAWPDDAVRFAETAPSGVRVDTSIEPGDEVGGRFDPLLAKVIAHAADRPTALQRLADGLDSTEVLGLPTNLAFLRRLVRLPVVRDGRARITTLEEDPAARAAAEDVDEVPAGLWAAAAAALTSSAAQGAWGGGWRLNLPATMRLEAVVGDRTLEHVAAADQAQPAESVLAALDDGVVHASAGGRSVPFRLQPPPDLARDARRAAGSGAASDVHSPMPGVVLAVHVEVGALVAAGDPVATLEAMKMEHVVTAPMAGSVVDVLVRAGEHVERGRLVARLGAAA